jgi:hypothetical protein
LINPNITEYIEKDGNKNFHINNFTVSFHTEDTKIVELIFLDKNTQLKISVLSYFKFLSVKFRELKQHLNNIY